MREQAGLREHYIYMKRLHAEGLVAAAGQLGSDGGLLLLRARDKGEADRVLAGAFVGEARPFTPRFVGPEPLVPVAP